MVKASTKPPDGFATILLSSGENERTFATLAFLDSGSRGENGNYITRQCLVEKLGVPLNPNPICQKVKQHKGYFDTIDTKALVVQASNNLSFGKAKTIIFNVTDDDDYNEAWYDVCIGADLQKPPELSFAPAKKEKVILSPGLLFKPHTRFKSDWHSR